MVKDDSETVMGKMRGKINKHAGGRETGGVKHCCATKDIASRNDASEAAPIDEVHYISTANLLRCA